MHNLSSYIGITNPGLDGQLTSLPHSDTIATWPDSGVNPLKRFESEGLGPLQAAAALAVYGLESGESLGPPLMTARQVHPGFRRFLDESVWAEALPHAARKHRLVLTAGLLQIFDFWDDSHEAAQQAGDLGERPYSASWHAVCHRREPDPGNAGYWLAKARQNPIGTRLAEIIESSLDRLDPGIRPVAERLIRGGEFQDRAMVEACCRPRPPDAEKRLLRQVQKLEMALLIGATLDDLA